MGRNPHRKGVIKVLLEGAGNQNKVIGELKTNWAVLRGSRLLQIIGS